MNFSFWIITYSFFRANTAMSLLYQKQRGKARKRKKNSMEEKKALCYNLFRKAVRMRLLPGRTDRKADYEDNWN